MSNAPGKKPDPDHPQKDDFELELPMEHGSGAPQGHPEGAAANEPHPLEALGLHASTDDFQFLGPVEELDFTEPADFTFPTDAPAEHEAVSDSTTDFAAVEHDGGIEHLFGSAEAAPEHAEIVDEAEAIAEPAPEDAEAVEAETAAEEAEPEPKVKPKRELPAWVHTLEWTTISVLAVGALIALFVSILWISDADTVTVVLNVCCPLMLALIPYALWRSSRRWTTPAGSVLYTILLVLGSTALIGGTWVEGTELAQYKWQFNKARLAAGKPHPKFATMPTEATDTGNPADNTIPANPANPAK